MPKRTSSRRIFLDTSGVIYEMHGHSLMRKAVQAAIADGHVEVSNFIRMEYLRGIILNLIDLYSLFKESDSVSDALIDWSQKVNQDRKLKVVLMTINGWLVNQEDWQARDKSMRRLGDLIVRFVSRFDESFPTRIKDELQCQLGRVGFSGHTFSEDMLFEFAKRFTAIQNSTPTCRLCEFKLRRRRHLTSKDIDICSASQREKFRSNKGFVKQAERLESAAATTDTSPKCRWCEQLGDSIIALHVHREAIIVTADKAFLAFGEILNRQVQLLPSLAQLKRQLAEEEQVVE